MADSSNTPKLDARIEAAAKAMYEADEDTNAGRTWEEVETGVAGWYRSMTTVALAAADSVPQPKSTKDPQGVWYTDEDRAAQTGEMEMDAVTPHQIVEQREAGWPDFHPEKFCHLCGRPNLRSWYVESPLWNAAHIEDEQERRGFRRSGIVCPQCFESLLAEAGGGHCTWELRPDPDTMKHLREDLRSDSVERPAVERLVAALRDVLKSESDEQQIHTLYGSGDSMGRRTCSACGFLWPCAYERARAALAEFGQQPTGDEQ